MAQQAGNSFVYAGVQYPSDVTAGLALGQAVAARVIQRARTDGSDATWTGSIPSGPGKWTGANPVLPQMANWQTWGAFEWGANCAPARLLITIQRK